MNVYYILSCYRSLDKWLNKYIRNLPVTEDMYQYLSALAYHSKANELKIQ